MFREDNSFKPAQKTVNCIFMNGGVGDHIASLVAVDYVVKTYPWVRLLVWVPDFLLDFSKHVLPSDTVVRSYTEMKRHYNQNKPTKTTAWDGHVSPMKTHCLDYAFLKLCDENPGVEHKNYLQINPNKINTTEFDLPKKYIVITTGYTAEVREFPAAHINKVAEYAKAKGVETVFLGQTQTNTGAKHVIKGNFSEEIKLEEGIDLIDRTTLLQAAKIMGNAAATLGVDNGLLHVAGCTQAPIIGGFTTVSPELRMPVRNNILGWNYYTVVPDENLGCKFCQVRTNFLYDHNYINCMYKDNLCTSQMTASKFIAHLERIL